MPRDAVSRTANVGIWLRKRNGGQKWVKDRIEHLWQCCDTYRMYIYIYIPPLHNLDPANRLTVPKIKYRFGYFYFAKIQMSVLGDGYITLP